MCNIILPKVFYRTPFFASVKEGQVENIVKRVFSSIDFKEPLAPFTKRRCVLVPSEDISLFDPKRSRKIPLAVYLPLKGQEETLPSVLIIPGYGMSHTEYSFLAKPLTEAGFVVLSIQQGQPGDRPLPMTGDILTLRKPIWDEGVKNIFFALHELERTHPFLHLSKIHLIGHSHGGDIAAVFASRYPKRISKIVSLDGLRVPFSKSSNVLLIPSIDKEADLEVRSAPHITVKVLEKIKHDYLSDRGPELVKNSVQQEVMSFFLEGIERNQQHR